MNTTIKLQRNYENRIKKKSKLKLMIARNNIRIVVVQCSFKRKTCIFYN